MPSSAVRVCCDLQYTFQRFVSLAAAASSAAPCFYAMFVFKSCPPDIADHDMFLFPRALLWTHVSIDFRLNEPA